jgi:large subunit ribosomal protein L22
MMNKYTYNPDPKKSSKVFGRGLNISHKSSNIVCSKISGMNLDKAKMFLMKMLIEKENIGGKHYTNVTKELIKLLRSAESNAEFKGMDPSRMLIHASAHTGFTFYRPRNWKRRMEKKKITNVQIVLEEK